MTPSRDQLCRPCFIDKAPIALTWGPCRCRCRCIIPQILETFNVSCKKVPFSNNQPIFQSFHADGPAYYFIIIYTLVYPFRALYVPRPRSQPAPARLLCARRPWIVHRGSCQPLAFPLSQWGNAMFKQRRIGLVDFWLRG